MKMNRSRLQATFANSRALSIDTMGTNKSLPWIIKFWPWIAVCYVLSLFIMPVASAAQCLDIFTSNQSFAVNGSVSIKGSNRCNNTTCEKPSSLTAPSLPEINPSGGFNLGKDAQLSTIAPGVYEYSSWLMNKGSEITKLGNGSTATAVIYIDGDATFSKSTSFNRSGDPSDFLFVVYRDLTIEKDAKINALFYVAGNATLEKNVRLRGAVSVSGDLTIEKNGRYDFSAGEIDSIESQGFCGTQVLDRFLISDSGSDASANVCVAEGVIIKALDSDDNVITDYNGVISLATSDNNGTWIVKQGQGKISYSADNDGTATYQFHNLDKGEISLELIHPDVANISVSVTDGNISTSHQIEFLSNSIEDEWLLEAGKFTLSPNYDRSSYQIVTFSQQYPTPPIVLLNATDQGSDPATLRIRNVTTSGFEVSQIEPSNSDGGHVAMNITYIALEPGVHVFPDGSKIEACVSATRRYQLQGDSNPSSLTVDFNHDFNNVPALVTTLQTTSNQPDAGPADVGEPWMTAAPLTVGSQSMELALERAEVNRGSITVPEVVGYAAIDSNVTGIFDDLLGNSVNFESLLTGAIVTGWDDSAGNVERKTQLSYDSAPLWAGSKNTRHGNNGGWLRRHKTTWNGLYMSIDEDRYSDSERNHIGERVGALIFDRVFAAKITGIGATIDHYRLEYQGQGLTCQASSIKVRACVDANCDTESTELAKGELMPANGWIGDKAISFTGNQNYSLASNTVQTLTLGLANMNPDVPLKCFKNGDADSDCQLTFSDTGFIFSNETDNNEIIPHQISGKPSNIEFNAKALAILVVKTDDDTGACTALFPSGGDIAVKLKYQCNNPSQCTTNGVVLSNNSSAKTLTTNYVSHQLRFDADSKAAIVINYPDAGKINLSVQKEITLDTGVTKLLERSSNDFVVKPFGLKLDFLANTNHADALATDSGGSVFKKAGEDFSVTVTAVQWQPGEDGNNDGRPDNLSLLNNNPKAGNFSDERLKLKHRLLSPSSGALGTLSGPLAAFQNGALTTTRNWSEVGIIGLDGSLVDGDYLGTGDIFGSINNVGRFVPDHFSLISAKVTPACGVYSYMDQPFSLAYSLTAFNAAGGTTLNYKDRHAKADVGFVAENNDDGNSLTSRLKITPSVNWVNGVYDQIAIAGKMERKPVPTATPFDLLSSANIGLQLFDGEITEDIPLLAKDMNASTAGACLTNCDAKSLNSNLLRFFYGRAVLKNAFGPEGADLMMPLETQYFDGNRFVLNQQDQCTSYRPSTATLTPASLGSLDSGDLSPIDAISDGLGGIRLPAPGQSGAIDLSLPVDSWLQFNWDGGANYNQEPTAVATFGRYRGNDRVIYWREVK